MSKRFQILSLDGGGLKGIFSAALLAHIEEDCQTKIIDHFDLIAGTSTGGIVALGLAMGLSPREIVRFYVDKGPKIFTNNPILLAKQCIKNKHNPLQLELALKECFGEKTLADSLNRIIIPSYNIGEDDIYLFKTPHNQRLSRDYKVPVWKVAMATSAAPTYLPTFKGFDHVRLVDGGIWANNPVMVAISEAISMLDVKMNDIYVMSIGTTYGVKGRSSKLDNGGFLQWRKDAVEVIMRAQSIGTLTQAQHLLGKEHISRLDPKVPDGLFALDKLSEKELLAKASHESRHFTPVFQETFCNHKAEEFIPLYTMEGEN